MWLKNYGDLPVEDEIHFFEVKIASVEKDAEQQEQNLHAQMLADALKFNAEQIEKGFHGRTVGKGDGVWETLTISHLSEKEIDAVIRGNARIFAYAWARWRDAPHDLDHCTYLQRPESTELKDKDLIWHLCSDVPISLKPPVKSQPEPQPKSDPTVQLAPTFGNIKERATKLADDILDDLYRHGWPMPPDYKPRFPVEPMPPPGKATYDWCQNRTDYFRWKFLHPVLDMRNEFYQFHLRDDELDVFLTDEGAVKQPDGTLLIQRKPDQPMMIIMKIDEIAKRLKLLADHTN
jgi:hypothetical protein